MSSKLRTILAYSVLAIPIVLLVTFATKRGYVFLIWNILLAALPILFGYLFIVTKSKLRYLWLVPWLVFLPNSFYVWTDIIHPFNVIQYFCPDLDYTTYCDQELIRKVVTPTWNGTWQQLLQIFGVVYAIFLSAWYGMIAWRQVTKELSAKLEWRVFLLFLPLNAFAIVVGRFARTNSWYLLTNPLRVIRDFADTAMGIFSDRLYTFTFVGSIIWTLLAYGIYHLSEQRKPQV
jgi:uncharacterized membrane protein